jgi:4-amino-4-deoxy-L-arabinose transferase-like glycosyltransferase
MQTTQDLKMSGRIWWLVLGLCVVLPLFLQLGSRGLNEPDEGRYSEIGREMLVSGDWMVPRINGVPHYAKPPWIYWCVAASLKVFGLNEWAARLPAALAAVATALTVFAMGRRMAGPLAGLLSSLALVTSLLFFGVARLITPDMMQTALITFALYCFWRWWMVERETESGKAPVTAVNAPRWKWLLGFYAVLGIAFLNKGPVALAVCALTVVGFLLMMGRLREMPRMGWGWGLLLLAAIALPWFLILAHRNPDLYRFYLVGEVAERVASGRGRVKSWYYFFLVLPIACWPWTLLAVSAFRRHFGWWWNREHFAEASAFLLSWIFFPFVLFTISSSKLPTYILPLVVPVSLLVGIWTAHLIKQERTVPGWANLATCIFLPLPVAAITWFAVSRCVPKLAWASREGQLVIAISIGALFVGAIMWWVLRFFTRGNMLATALATWWLCAALLLQLLVLKMDRLETMLGHNSSWRELCRALDGMDVKGVPLPLDLHPRREKMKFSGNGPWVIIYDYYFRGASFYLMKDRPEIVPGVACESLWEIEKDKEAEQKLVRDDLIPILKGPETVYVFSKPEAREELRRLTGLELPILKSAASGKYQLLLFTNRKMK